MASPCAGRRPRRSAVRRSARAGRACAISRTYAEPDDPQALFRLSWLRPLYRALCTRAEFRERSVAEQWTVLQQAARQITEGQPDNEHYDLSTENPAEVLSWLEAARRRAQRSTGAPVSPPLCPATIRTARRSCTRS